MTNELLIIILLIINLCALCVILIAILGNRESMAKYMACLTMSIMLLFRKKIKIFPRVDHYSPHQGSEHFYLLRMLKGSHQRFFKVISGSYITIIPESDVLSIK